MAGIPEVAAVLGGLKAALDIASALRKADNSLELAELKLQLVGLMTSLAEAKLGLLDVEEAMKGRDDRIAGLEEALRMKEKLVRYNDAYYTKGENGEPSGDPYCSRCIEVGHKAVHIHQSPLRRSLIVCPECNATIQWRPT